MQNVNSPNELAKSLEEFMASNSYLKATTQPSPLEVLASSKRHYSEIESSTENTKERREGTITMNHGEKGKKGIDGKRVKTV